MVFKLDLLSQDISLHPLAQYMTKSDAYPNARVIHEHGFL